MSSGICSRIVFRKPVAVSPQIALRFLCVLVYARGDEVPVSSLSSEAQSLSERLCEALSVCGYSEGSLLGVGFVLWRVFAKGHCGCYWLDTWECCYEIALVWRRLAVGVLWIV